MNEKGYILLSRAILDSDVFASQKLLKIWIWCLCKANFKDRSIPLKIGRGETVVKVKRGQFIFGRFKAEEELFIDGSTIYKSIKKLEEHQMIKIESSNQYSVITICKYDTYQDNNTYKITTKEQPRNSQVTSGEQPSNTTNTLPNVKNDNNVNINIYTDFLKKNYSVQFESLQIKLRGIDEEKFWEFFENKCILENIPLEIKKINARFNLLLSNWNKEKSSAKKENIPSFEEFKKYAIEKSVRVKRQLDESKLILKYDSWVENNWKDGNDNPIKNWKSKLNNTLQYLFTQQINNTINPQELMNNDY